MGDKRVFITREPTGAVRSEVDLGGVELVVPAGEAPDAEEVRAEAARSDAIVVTISEPLDAAFFAGLAEGHRLRVVSSMSTGVDHIDQEAAARAGVEVLRLPGSVTAPATAELAWTLVLGAARGIRGAAADLSAGDWSRWDPWRWTGLRLDGATLGIVGFGAIGERVARYGAAFGMKVLCATRTVPAAGEHPGVRFVGLDELAASSDVISLHVPLTPQTTGLVDADFLARVREGTVLINTARGGVVDEHALLDALNSGRLSGAGLDVHPREPAAADDPLVRHPRVLALPHIGSATTVTRVEMVVGALNAALTALDQPGS